MGDTLLLNADNRPSAVLTWQKAIELMLRDVVYVISTYEDWVVRSVSQAFKVPSVIMLKKWVPTNQRISFNRTNVYLRDKHTCQYCGKSPHTGDFPMSELTFDHVLPRSKGGATAWTNIVTACGPCNRRKGDRVPAAAAMSLLSVPIEPKSMEEIGFGIKAFLCSRK